MAYDLKIVKGKSGEAVFEVYGKSDNSPLMVLQKLYVKLFENPDGSYRDDGTVSILSFLDGGNTPDMDIMNELLAISCTRALEALEEDDAALVSDFTAVADENMNITCQLTMADGTYVQEMIRND